MARLHTLAFTLTTGETFSRAALLVTSADSTGIQAKTGEGEYGKIPWELFQQKDLQIFSEDDRLKPFVEPALAH